MTPTAVLLGCLAVAASARHNFLSGRRRSVSRSRLESDMEFVPGQSRPEGRGGSSIQANSEQRPDSKWVEGDNLARPLAVLSAATSSVLLAIKHLPSPALALCRRAGTRLRRTLSLPHTLLTAPTNTRTLGSEIAMATARQHTPPFDVVPGTTAGSAPTTGAHHTAGTHHWLLARQLQHATDY